MISIELTDSELRSLAALAREHLIEVIPKLYAEQADMRSKMAHRQRLREDRLIYGGGPPLPEEGPGLAALQTLQRVTERQEQMMELAVRVLRELPRPKLRDAKKGNTHEQETK